MIRKSSRTYTAGGSQHCILPFDRFYTEKIAGLAFHHWVADMAAGRDVPGVACEDCKE